MPHFRYSREVGYPRPGLFDIVADVERYPEFMPGWVDARVVEREGDTQTVEQTLGGFGLSWTFRTRVTLTPPEECRIESRDGPFEHLFERWRFQETAPRRTLVSFEADYRLRGWHRRQLARLTFREGFRQALRAFERRADAKLGHQ